MHEASSTGLGTCSAREPSPSFHPFHSPLSPLQPHGHCPPNPPRRLVPWFPPGLDSKVITRRAFSSRLAGAFPRFCPHADARLTPRTFFRCTPRSASLARAHKPPRAGLRLQPLPGARAQGPGSGAGPRPGPEQDGPRAQGPRSGAGGSARASGGGAGDKERPYLCWGRRHLPAGGSRAHPRGHVRGVPAGKGPARAGGAGRSPPGHAPCRGPWAQRGRGQPGPDSLSLPLARPLIHIHEEGQGRDPGPPPCPPPLPPRRPRVQPRRRPRPQWGAPGFRLGEGVSTWSRLKNVSLPLLRPLVPALREGEGERAEGLSRGSGEDGRGCSSYPGQVRGDSGLTAPSCAPSKIAPVIILILKTE